MNNEETLQAQHAIKHILAGLNIETVVCIDDIYAVNDFENSIAIAIGWFTEALFLGKSESCNELVDQIFDQSSFFDVDDDEIWKRRLRGNWQNLDEERRILILDQLAKVLGSNVNIERDQVSASLLKSLIPEEVELRELTPAEWEASQADMFGKANDQKSLLCLFDHNLEAADDYSSNGGILLLEKAIKARGDRPVICGLLTHTVKVDEEISQSRQFADEHNLKREDFLVLSKDRLNDSIQFAHGLKMMSLNHARDFLTAQVREIVTQADEYANDKLMTVDIYDFDHMILRSSEKEGVWEAETLFRLFDILRITAFREKVFAPENKSKLDSKISQIRTIREVPTLPDEQDHPPNQRWEIRRLELYESGDFINRAHLPLELGDIFELSDRKFILIAQPCDLMVRGKGGGKGHRQADIVTLVTITKEPPKNPESGTSFTLHYFDTSGEKAYVKFRSAYHISADVLDLAVFNSNGDCRLNLSDTVSDTLHLSWRERYKIIKKKFKNYQEQSKTLLDNFGRANLRRESKELLKKSLTGRLTLSNLNVTLDFNLLKDGVFKFGIRRIGRYRQPGAGVLLGNYFAFLSRNAEEHDFVMPDENT